MGKNARSHLDLDPCRFKVQGVLGACDFTVYIYAKEACNFEYTWVINKADSWSM
jgi:hypothetical protein